MSSIVRDIRAILTGFHIALVLPAMFPEFFNQLVSDGCCRAAELWSRVSERALT
jgi:hypothetical protein